MVRCVSPQEGAVVSVHHFNTELGSPLVYGTRKGGVRSWDLRAREVRGMGGGVRPTRAVGLDRRRRGIVLFSAEVRAWHGAVFTAFADFG